MYIEQEQVVNFYSSHEMPRKHSPEAVMHTYSKHVFLLYINSGFRQKAEATEVKRDAKMNV